MRSDGSHERLTTSPMTAIARGTNGGVGAVGTTVERWDGTRFQPVVFQLADRRAPGRRVEAGEPIDLCIDPKRRWHVLFKKGVLVTLSEKGAVERLLTPADGLPASAARVLWNERGGYLIVGAPTVGLYWVAQSAFEAPGDIAWGPRVRAERSHCGGLQEQFDGHAEGDAARGLA